MKLLFYFVLVTSFCSAQNTLSLPENAVPPKASLADASFMTGHWKGQDFGGTTEEIWTAGEGNSMLFTFRLVIDGKVNFYEIGHIIEDGDSLLLQLKHFGGDLKGWEEKEETEDFKLVKKEANKIYFDGLTYEKVNENELNAYVLVKNKDGTQEEMKFNFKRQ
tara:strand:+ start:6052 stop:6540 length:489 start_codon:yes stop_codon:yes gene_type:complete